MVTKIIQNRYILYIYIGVLLIIIYLSSNGLEGFNDKNELAFFLVTHKAHPKWISFLNTFTDSYDVFIVIDDNSFDNIEASKKYPHIHFILINEDECKGSGFWDASYLIKKEVIAWDKALYYFTRINTKYENVWFCEDDVFIYDVNTIKAIDKQYSTSDLLCVNKIFNSTGEVESLQLWREAEKYFDLPWSGAYISCCRLSKGLLKKIDEFVIENKRLVFLEVMFIKLAQQNKLTIRYPKELSGINHLSRTSDVVESSSIVYHAIKNVDEHVRLRNITYSL